MKTDEVLRLSDGRQLGYCIQGDPTGKPVLFIHGNPGSRHMHHPDESIALRLGLRVITPDRPGYGLSDFNPKRTIANTPDDFIELMDALGVDQFAVMGVSAGGAYVLSTAHHYPDRVTKCAIISGSAPFDRPGALEDINEDYRQAYLVSKWNRWLLKGLMTLQMWNESRKPDAAWNSVLERASESDRKILTRPEVEAQVRAYRPEAVRNGVDGWVHEAKLLVKPWGFPMNDVPQEVHLWYWDQDTIVPLQMGRFISKTLQHKVEHFLPDGGHFSWIDHWREILESIA